MIGISAERKSQFYAMIGCQRLTSTHKGCNRQSVMSRPQYEQKSLIDQDSASDKLSEEK